MGRIGAAAVGAFFAACCSHASLAQDARNTPGQHAPMPTDPFARRLVLGRCPTHSVARHVITMPDWIERPSPEALRAVYPPAALAAKISGHVVVQCSVGVDEMNHECRVVEVTPAGQGFGAAALRLAQLYVMEPKRIDCIPVDGGIVKYPFAFNPG